MRFLVYVHYSHEPVDPHTWAKRRCARFHSSHSQCRLLQLLLIASEVVLWWIPMVGFGMKLYWRCAFVADFQFTISYYVGHTGKMLKNIPFAEVQNQRRFLDVYPLPENSHKNYEEVESVKRPVIIFVHGGAWGWNGKEDHHLVGRFLQSKGTLDASRFPTTSGFVTVVPNYSRYPFGHVEDMVGDIDEVIEWTFKNISKYGGDSKEVIVLGHSAGSLPVVFKINTLKEPT